MVLIKTKLADGIRFSMGSSDNVAFNNHIVINGEDERYTVFMYRGSDLPEVAGSDGRPRYNHVYNNSLISDDSTIKVIEADDNIFEVRVVHRHLCRTCGGGEVGAWGSHGVTL